MSKECLKNIAKDFLIELDKLKKVSGLVTQRNFDDSWFLENDDVKNINARKLAINSLFQPVEDEIFRARGSLKREFIPSGSDLNTQITLIQSRIDKLSDEDCAKILTDLKTKIDEVMSGTPNKENISDNEHAMKTADKSGMRAALQVHSFEDKWIFTFLAKMVQSIQEALGMKTSSEKLLDDSIDKIESSVSP